LEVGVFRWPAAAEGQASVTLRAAELAMLLDGIDWSKASAAGVTIDRPPAEA
jgi:transposase